jgi:para-aminobenzoate synthetase/4-amino-4-deoxychorismate lyase
MLAVSASPGPDPDLGVLETVLVLDGRPVELDAHMARLANSLAELFDASPPPSLAGTVRAKAAAIGRGGLRVVVAPDEESVLAAEVLPAEIEAELALPSEPALVTAHSLVLSNGLGHHKWADRSLLDQAQATLPADAVALIVDWEGIVLEAARGNVFAVVEGTLTTHPADGRVLPGIARARALEAAQASGIEVRETALSRAEMIAAEEVFLTGSLRGVERVRELDGASLPVGGEISDSIAAELRGAWGGDGLDRVPRR